MMYGHKKKVVTVSWDGHKRVQRGEKDESQEDVC